MRRMRVLDTADRGAGIDRAAVCPFTHEPTSQEDAVYPEHLTADGADAARARVRARILGVARLTLPPGPSGLIALLLGQHQAVDANAAGPERGQWDGGTAPD